MIDSYLQRHEAFLKQTLTNTPMPAAAIRSATEYVLFPGGKRIRPILVYLSGSLFNIDTPVLDVVAAAIELTHCYSLVHDDLPAMDNDDFRRGKLSCHKQYDEATAILVGDGLQALAIEVLLSGLGPLLPAHQVVQITKELVAASGVSGMVSGQSLDLSELNKKALPEKELAAIHQLKTGKLIVACFTMVLATQESIEHAIQQALISYAHHVGLVFQIQDDYLDHYAPQNHLGKNRCSDLINEKTTFATLFSKNQLEEKINYHFEQAFECLTLLGIKAHPLVELTQQLHKRSQF